MGPRRSTRLAKTASPEVEPAPTPAPPKKPSPRKAAPAAKGKKPTGVTKKSAAAKKKLRETIAANAAAIAATQTAPENAPQSVYGQLGSYQSPGSEDSWDGPAGTIDPLLEWPGPGTLTDRLNFTRTWDSSLGTRWLQLCRSVEDLAEIVAEALPHDSYSDIAAPWFHTKLLKYTQKPELYYDDTAGEGRKWLLQAWIWRWLVREITPGERPKEFLVAYNKNWQMFAKFEADVRSEGRLEQEGYKASDDFLEHYIPWRANTAKMLWAKYGSPCISPDFQERILFRIGEFRSGLGVEVDAEAAQSTPFTWPMKIMNQALEVGRAAEGFQVLMYGVEEHNRIYMDKSLMASMGNSENCPYEDLETHGISSTWPDGTGIDLVIQPGLKSYYIWEYPNGRIPLRMFSPACFNTLAVEEPALVSTYRSRAVAEWEE